MHLNDLDLNLLRLFDAVYRARNVSRAAELLGLTQPAANQGLARLRHTLGDALFVRSAGGMAPTPRAHRLAQAVQAAIATLEAALGEADHFDPATARMDLRLHLSDIGEARFLPALMRALRQQVPGLRVHSRALAHEDIALALDSGTLDLAIGFLPSVHETLRVPLLEDRYIVLVRADHPLLAHGQRKNESEADGEGGVDLRALEYVAVRSHSDTLRILQLLRLDERVRLTASHFLALPPIVRTTDLGVIMPLEIAREFAAAGGYALVRPRMPLQDFTVSLHWSRRFDADPAHRWLRTLVVDLFGARAPA
ncbi:MAG: PCP degradation transcriptional activation protein [Paracidovorax wautersii]|uniref:PCP degradation transcriptional activation protein n=1 Tax=Paracidovorax wautersii TaxID=1177982 RepID=A0A7V8FR84_9BURK|nr:MAG: PCP degradation transcriptional activation protein [Paracidovorax wautersii]